jgi:hypothetical protein
MSEMYDDFTQYFKDLRLFLEIITVAAVFSFLAITTLGCVIAYQAWRIANTLVDEHQRLKTTSSGVAPHIPYGPNNPYGRP